MKKILSSLLMFSMVLSMVGSLPVNAKATATGVVKINICHKAGESGNWNALHVDEEGWGGHKDHPGDYFYTGPTNHDGTPDGGDEWCANNFPKEEEPQTATISATKVVCNSEADLPNWGDHKDDNNVDVSITSETATDWVKQSDGNCELVDWNFEWAPSNTDNPGDNQEEGGDGWTPFANTVSIPVPSNPSYVWVREQIPEDYVPFSEDTTAPYEDVSAEFYCNIDVLHYDNYDRVDNMVAGETYDCVGFNVLEKKSCDAEDVANVYESDITTLEDGNPSVLVSPIHKSWVSSIADSAAKWIWGENPIADPVNEVTQTFTKTFTITGNPKDSNLELAADNSFSVLVNGNPVAADATEFNYGATKSYVIPAAALVTGSNTITFTIKNFAQSGGTMASNPAGLMYKLVIHEDGCLPPPPPPQACDADINLLENGNFEAPELANGTWDIIPDSNPLLKWQVAWSNPQGSGRLGLEIQNHVAGDPAEGDQHAELDGDHPVTIWQTIPTIPGKEYSFTFKYSPRPGRDLADDSMQVKIDGSVLGAAIATDGTANSSTVWETITRNFVATGSTTKVEIYDNGTDTSFGGYVDDASVRCIGKPQEPTTGHIIVNKVTNVSTEDTFDFTTTGTGYIGFSLSNGGTNDQTLASGNTYSVLENVTKGWNSDGGVCTTNQDYIQTPGSINLHAGETVTCTFTNTFVPPNSAPACSDKTDNDEDGLNNENDPGCHSDGNVNNPGSYVPSDNDESNTSNQCGDGKDNDGDEVIDSQDPGCHSDGNASNDDTYNPDDNDETEASNNNGGGRRSSGSRATPQGQVLGAETSCGIYVDKFIRKGYKNDIETVKKIQTFLNDYMKSGLVVDGIYGGKTEAAVKAFQLAHKSKILDPWKLLGPTGIFYLTTQTEVNNIMCPALDLPIPELIPIETNPLAPKKA